MEVASLSPVPVGVLTWNSPDPCATIIVKATFDIEADGSVSLVPDQPQMSLDLATSPQEGRELGLHGAELFYGTDFAPRKGAVDVLAIGHARAKTPSRRIPFRLRVDGLDLALVAVADEDRKTIPLSERYVRRVPTDPATAVRLAPANSSVMGWISRTVAPGFDFSVFNTAPHGHRIARLAPDAHLETVGLLRGGDRPVQLAGVSPRVFHVEDRGATHPGDAVAMVCDTLWLDTDREHVTLVWRGTIPRSQPGERPFIVVKLHGRGEVTWSDMSRGLSRAAWFDATESHTLRRRSEAPIASQSEPTLTALNALNALDTPESTTQRLAKKLRWKRQSELPPATARTGVQLGAADPSALGDGTLVDPDQLAITPFAPGKSGMPNASAVDPRWRDLAGATLDEDEAVTMAEPMPFTPPSQPIPLSPKSEPATEQQAPLSDTAAPIPLSPKTIRRGGKDDGG